MSSFFSVTPPAPSKARQANKYVKKGGKHPWKTVEKRSKKTGRKLKAYARILTPRAAKAASGMFAQDLIADDL